VQGEDGFPSQTGTAVTRSVPPATVTQDAQCRVEADVVVECTVRYSGVGLSPQEQALMDKENLQQTKSTSMVLKPMTAVAGVEKLAPGATGSATTATATTGNIMLNICRGKAFLTCHLQLKGPRLVRSQRRHPNQGPVLSLLVGA
jgi:hypothetical protein